MTLGVIEILLVLLVFVVVGPRRIADLFRSMGRGVHDFVGNLGSNKDDGEKKELPETDKDDKNPGE